MSNNNIYNDDKQQYLTKEQYSMPYPHDKDYFVAPADNPLPAHVSTPNQPKNDDYYPPTNEEDYFISSHNNPLPSQVEASKGFQHDSYYMPPADNPLPSHVTPANEYAMSNRNEVNAPLIRIGYEEEQRNGFFFKNGLYKPYFTYTITLIQIGVFIFQLINMATLTGSPIQTQPFNFLIGPTPEVLITQGARFSPCMKHTNSNNMLFPCPKDSNNLIKSIKNDQCSLQQLCSLSEFKNNQPDQWYRFITPIFLHGGVLHILLNLLAQFSIGSHLENRYGGLRILVIYFAAGIGGNLLGGNLAQTKAPSVGASGAIFGLMASDLLDLLLYWDHVLSPWCELIKIVLCIVVSLAFGLIPIVDNFAHIGGFIGGLFSGVAVMLSHRHPKTKRKVTWGFIIAVSLVAFVILVVFYYFSINGFYTQNWAEACPACKYFNCIPVAGLCDMYSV